MMKRGDSAVSTLLNKNIIDDINSMKIDETGNSAVSTLLNKNIIDDINLLKIDESNKNNVVATVKDYFPTTSTENIIDINNSIKVDALNKNNNNSIQLNLIAEAIDHNDYLIFFEIY
jgi:hypothetical protein